MPRNLRIAVGDSLTLRFNPARMSTAYQIVVCGSIVPDPLQTLEPVASPTGPAVPERELSQLAAGGKTSGAGDYPNASLSGEVLRFETNRAPSKKAGDHFEFFCAFCAFSRPT